MNQVMQMMLNQLQSKNPKMFQKVNGFMKSNGNPMELFKEVTNGYTPEQMNTLFARAKNIGVPDDVIGQIKNGMNAK